VPTPSRKLARLGIVAAGIVALQCILFGPSLLGQRILLPLDSLARPNVYLPREPGAAEPQSQDPALSDLVLQFEADRRFAARELAAGRFPLWTPYQYGGVPFIWPKYSPFFLPTAWMQEPLLLAWTQLLAALVTGIGMYLFLRRALGTGFWPAALVAWCQPLSGFFTMWLGFPTCAPAYWLPWLLLAVDRTIRFPSLLRAVALAGVTALVWVSGHIDVAGQVLGVAGLYALWCLLDVHRRQLLRVPALRAACLLTLGWTLGSALAAPHVLPIVEYARTGYRVTQRAEGLEERPPVGLSALPQLLLPDVYGSTERGGLLLRADVGGNLLESPVAGYAGLLATALVAPLAFFSRRHRSVNGFWLFLAIFGMGWCLAVPGLVELLRLPGLRLMSHNRLVFATSFALLALAGTGLEALRCGQVRWRRVLWIPAGVLAGLLVWSLVSAFAPPEPLASEIENEIRAGGTRGWVRTPEDVVALRGWFTGHYLAAAFWCALGVAGWLAIRSRRVAPRVLASLFGALMLADLFWFSWGRSPQSERALDFPAIPALTELAQAEPGRVIGYGALPAKLAQAIGLRDPRGYDSVDPGRWTQLLKRTADPRAPFSPYAVTQFLMPRIRFAPPDRLAMHPILDMLNVRYLIFRGTPPAEVRPHFQSPDYWIIENRRALPRVFVPRRVEFQPDAAVALKHVGSGRFDPRALAYVESEVSLPEDANGEAAILDETPSRIRVEARMQTPGLLVQSDTWDPGWRAYLGERALPILRTNTALRGVVLPAGVSQVEFRYEPASVRRAFWISGASALLLLGATLSAVFRSGFRAAAGSPEAHSRARSSPAP
jgi:hypothetical protein